jgi:hypothetical protein
LGHPLRRIVGDQALERLQSQLRSEVLGTYAANVAGGESREGARGSPGDPALAQLLPFTS